MQNEQDLEKLVHAHTAALLRYCTGLLGCEADAQGCCAENLHQGVAAAPHAAP